MCGCERHHNAKAACTCECRTCNKPSCFQEHVDPGWLLVPADTPAIYVVRDEVCYTVTVQHAAVDMAERLGSIDRASLVAQFRAIADVIERNAPCETRASA